MKKYLLTLVASVIGLISFAAGGPQLQNLFVLFYWPLDPTDLGGLSTNDYMTNIVFNLYSSTNVSAPVQTWPLLLSVPGQSYLPQGLPGSTWSNAINVDSYPRFYVLQVSNQNGGVSPFSQVAPWVPNPGQGRLWIRK